MVDAKVVKVGNIQHVIASPAVGIDDTIRHHLALDDWDQRSARSIWDYLGVDLPPLFNKPKTGTLPVAPRPRLPFRLPPK